MEDRVQQIRIKAILEVIGKPKEYIEQKLSEYITKIEHDENALIVSKKILPAQEHEKVFSTVAELEVIIKGLSNLVGFCIDYMPSSIEILKPEQFNFPERTFTEFVNDMIAKLHKVDLIAKTKGQENSILKDTVSKLIRNHLLVAIAFGVQNIEGLVKSSGIAKTEVKRYLDALQSEGRITEDKGYYLIAKHG
jgi:hypothetical protein